MALYTVVALFFVVETKAATSQLQNKRAMEKGKGETGERERERDTEGKRTVMAIRRMRNLDTETDACIPVAWLHPLQANPCND